MVNFSDLAIFRNIHKGQRAFVVGAGYSLNDFDTSKITDKDIVLAVNHGCTVLKHCHYFCFTDGSIPYANFFKHATNISDKIMCCANLTLYEHLVKVNMYELIKDKTYFLNRRYTTSNNLNFNFWDGLLIDGNDVSHVVSHLAHVLGCNPIILVGIDLNYRTGVKYCTGTIFKEKVIWPKEAPIIYSSLPDGRDDINLNMSYNLWCQIKNQNPQVKFININPNSRLTTLFGVSQI